MISECWHGCDDPNCPYTHDDAPPMKIDDSLPIPPPRNWSMQPVKAVCKGGPFDGKTMMLRLGMHRSEQITVGSDKGFYAWDYDQHLDWITCL